MTTIFLLARAISTPSDNKLIIGLILLVIVLLGISLAIGWLFSRLLNNEGTRKKGFRIISITTLILLMASLTVFYFYFIS